MHKEVNLLVRTRRFIRQSMQLMSESEKLMAEWQQLFDDHTAKTLKRVSARLKRKSRLTDELSR